ncbi:phosphatidylinositol polyphosphate 5-phosphatase type IV isoform X1 [Megalops cyprinoides]|uniref:phosphatidylinositol polyphosphate 5-phosphatase type IV isoform X1 n=1 Tax=Megalops cyprinoides TaxID=118141 RepID=UPI0018651ACD|nr:phosphatidylinositol polyphosphate 5-phosphatase type IV isoform X1 [Megalops cyprinoides]XP_036384755.1 phosphatidylinositol polyphosphate 5-phosphatase type IV isoform X1 [Megalops cyprinoides]
MNTQNGICSQPVNSVLSVETAAKDSTERLREEKLFSDAEEDNSNKVLQDTLRLSTEETDQREVLNSYCTQHPHLPKPPNVMTTKTISSARVRRRKLKANEESLTDPSGPWSSTDSLQGDGAGRPADALQNGQKAADGALSDSGRDVSTSRDQEGGLSDPEGKNADLYDPAGRHAKIQLLPLQPSGPSPAAELCAESTSLKASNQIDQDCEDYIAAGRVGSEHLHSNHYDSRLSETMVSDNTSLNSMKSTFSVLNPIRPRDARNRSFLEGSVLGHGALLGAGELDRYFPERRVGVYIVTWNMQGEKDFPSNLDDLLLPLDAEIAQDLYIIGVQEGCADRREWEIRLQESLGPYYVMLYAAAHGVLYLSVFIRRDLIWFCSAEVEHATVTTRIISQIKTKGAVGVSFTFFGTSFLFITSHFTSGENKVYERILDYNKIIEALTLPRMLPDTNPYRSVASDVTTRFDEVFWFGDFNFRLSKDRAGVEVILKDELGSDMRPLLQYDQLSKEMKDGAIFKGFQEAPIHFLPTYKFDIGYDVYDTTSKQRTPSYTDRILYRSRQKDDIKVVRYSCCSSVKTSDHRPVIGIFQVKLQPGRDNIPLGAGQFDRDLYLEGIRRRITRELKWKEAMKNQKNSTVCSIS